MPDPHAPDSPEQATVRTPADVRRTVEHSSRSPGNVGEYEITGLLGRGGAGEVYLGRHTKLGRPAAVKMPLAGDSEGSALRFLAEAEAVAAVRHPHVIQVYDFAESDGRPYLAMEYLSGGSLADRLRTAGPMPPREAAGLVAKLAAGVQAAHDQGIVHRDLKPGNVLFDEGGEPKVSDFGLAKRGGASDLTRTNAVMGTPSYMAPEQAAGRTRFVGPGADVYALGVILFECLTGRVPFEAEDALSLLRKVVEEAPPRVRRLAPGVPKGLEDVIRRCLAKDPRDRYPTAGQLAEDLRRIAAGEAPRYARGWYLALVFGTLDSGRHAAELVRYAAFFEWLAVCLLGAQVAQGLWMLGHVPASLGFGIPTVLAVAFLASLAFVWLRSPRRGLVPESVSERCLWATLGGLGLATVVPAFWPPQFYSSAMSFGASVSAAAVAMFAWGPNFWGWCYLFGAGFLALPFVMAARPQLTPFVYGGYWAVVLFLISRHLRRLARDVAPDKSPP